MKNEESRGSTRVMILLLLRANIPSRSWKGMSPNFSTKSPKSERLVRYEVSAGTPVMRQRKASAGTKQTYPPERALEVSICLLHLQLPSLRSGQLGPLLAIGIEDCCAMRQTPRKDNIPPYRLILMLILILRNTKQTIPPEGARSPKGSSAGGPPRRASISYYIALHYIILYYIMV